jgi:hypothetical protein
MGVPTEVERIIDLLEANTDAFGNNINERTNVLDLAAHYPISPEQTEQDW